MEGLCRDLRLHLMSYLPVEGLCRLVQTCHLFSDVQPRDVNKLFYALYIRDYVPLLKPFTKADMEEWFLPFYSETLPDVLQMPSADELKELWRDIKSTPLHQQEGLERIEALKFDDTVDWKRLYQLLHSTKMTTLRMMLQHAEALLVEPTKGPPARLPFVRTPDEQDGIGILVSTRFGVDLVHTVERHYLYSPSGCFGHFVVDLNADVFSGLMERMKRFREPYENLDDIPSFPRVEGDLTHFPLTVPLLMMIEADEGWRGHEMALSQEVICLKEGIFRKRSVSDAELQNMIAYQRQVHEQALNRNGPVFLNDLDALHGKNCADLYEMVLPNHAVRHLLNSLKRQLRQELRERAQAGAQNPSVGV
jgi:DNA-binding protein Fis